MSGWTEPNICLRCQNPTSLCTCSDPKTIKEILKVGDVMADVLEEIANGRPVEQPEMVKRLASEWKQALGLLRRKMVL